MLVLVGILSGDLGRNMWTTVTTFKKKHNTELSGFMSKDLIYCAGKPNTMEESM